MRFFAAILFISLLSFDITIAQTDSPGWLTPPRLADRVASTFACMSSGLFGFMLINVPVAFTVFYFAQYLNISRKSRQEGKESFYSDELLVLVISSFIVAILVRLLYTFWEYSGIPVRSLLGKYLYCNPRGLENACTGFFLPGNYVVPDICRATGLSTVQDFNVAMEMLLSAGSFFVKVFLLFVPIIAVAAMVGKNFLNAYRDVKERRSSPGFAVFYAFVDSVVIMLTLIFYTGIIYQLLYVNWNGLVDWLGVVLRESLRAL